MRKLFLFFLFLILLVIFPWILISWSSYGSIYRDLDVLPTRKVGLLLGTTPSVAGVDNLFYTTRIEATKMLYERGKIRHIIVSGDNSTPHYNEPEAMRRSLIKAGIPERDITLDYAGFRTLDSVIRAKEVFGQNDDIIIISQPFHLERALFIARAYNIDAIGYGAANVNLDRGLYTYLREIIARWIAIYDVLSRTHPKVLGDAQEIYKE